LVYIPLILLFLIICFIVLIGESLYLKDYENVDMTGMHVNFTIFMFVNIVNYMLEFNFQLNDYHYGPNLDMDDNFYLEY